MNPSYPITGQSLISWSRFLLIECPPARTGPGNG
jgi:hypothetical protein